MSPAGIAALQAAGEGASIATVNKAKAVAASARAEFGLQYGVGTATGAPPLPGSSRSKKKKGAEDGGLSAETRLMAEQNGWSEDMLVFQWSSFHHALVHIACRLYPDAAARDVGEAYDQLVAERIRPHAVPRAEYRLSDWLDGSPGGAQEIEDLRRKFSMHVHDIFEEFGGHPTERELEEGRHPPRPDLPASRQALHCDRYLIMCSKMKLIAEEGYDVGRYAKFTQEELLGVFLDCTEERQVDFVGSLRLEEFWATLVRLAWLAAEKAAEHEGEAMRTPKEEMVKFTEQLCNNVRMDMGLVNRRVWRVCVALFEQAYQSHSEVKATKTEASTKQANASSLYHTFCRYNSSGKMNRATFINFVVECQLIDKKFTAWQAGVLFDKTKGRKRTTLDSREFEEALRQMAVLKRYPFSELVNRALRVTGLSASGQASGHHAADKYGTSQHLHRRMPSQVPGTGDFASASDAAPAVVRGENHATSVNYRRELEIIYTRNCPARLKNVNALLSKWRGKEEALLRKVKRKYNVKTKGAKGGEKLQAS